MFIEDSGAKDGDKKNVFMQRSGSRAFLDRVARLFQRRDSIHIHRFRTTHEFVTGVFQKGSRERFATPGSIEECTCGEAKFVPTDENLSVVDCEKIKEE